jgi:putative oxidoreductase
MRVSAREVIAWLPRVGLGALFIAAGLSKLRDPAALAQEIGNYQLFTGAAPYLAIALPAAEVVAGLALLLGPRPWRAAGAAAIALMLVMFTGAVVWALLRGLNIDCACFGTGSGAVTWQTFARNAVLLVAAAVILRMESRRRPQRPRGHTPPPPQASPAPASPPPAE